MLKPNRQPTLRMSLTDLRAELAALSKLPRTPAIEARIVAIRVAINRRAK